MKKTVSILLVVSLLCSVVLVLSSCKKCKEHVDENFDTICDVCEEDAGVRSMKPSDLVLKSMYEEDADFSKAELVSDLKNMSVDRSNGSLVVFRNYNATSGDKDYCIVNAESGKIVYTHVKDAVDAKTALYSVDISVDYGNRGGREGFFYIVNKTVADDGDVSYTITAYTSSGNSIASVTEEIYDGIEYVNHRLGEFFEFDDKLYTVKNGVAEYKFDATFVSVPDCDYSTDKYHYDLVPDAYYGSIDNFKVYDNNFKLVRYYTKPAGANYMRAYLLASGNILIQYTVALPDDAFEYDIYSDGKYNLVSVLYNVDDGSETPLELNFVIGDIMNASIIEDYDTVISGNVPNIAYINIIENKSTNSDTQIVSFSNDGKILAYLNNMIPAQSDIPEMIKNNRYLLHDKTDRYYIVDGEGAIICEATKCDDVTADYIELDGKYYDLSLKPIFDPETDGYEQYGSYNVYYKVVDGKNEYYVFDGGKLNKIENSGDITALSTSNGYLQYTLKSDGNTYKVYRTYSGEEIFKIQTNASPSVGGVNASTYGDILVITVETYENYNYVRNTYIAKR